MGWCIVFLILPTNFTNPEIKRNGVSCPANICMPLTNLNAGNVTFNVTSWTSYCIGNVGSGCFVGNLPPFIPPFIPPTSQLFADLVISSFAVSNVLNTSVGNYAANYSFVISNIGNASAASSVVGFSTIGNFSCSGSAGGCGAGGFGFAIPSLTSGQNYSSIVGQQLATFGGNFTTSIAADVNSQITERDEDNNNATLSFFIYSNGSVMVSNSSGTTNPPPSGNPGTGPGPSGPSGGSGSSNLRPPNNNGNISGGINNSGLSNLNISSNLSDNESEDEVGQFESSKIYTLKIVQILIFGILILAIIVISVIIYRVLKMRKYAQISN